jgi:hypothetical protein
MVPGIGTMSSPWALLDQAGHRSNSNFDRYSRVDPVLAVEIDGVDARTLQTRFARADDIFGSAVRDLAAAIAQVAEFRRHHDAGSASLDSLADDFFIVPPAVHVGAIEHRDASPP